MPQERDEKGRYIPKKGDVLEKVITFRVTEHEYKMINEAKKSGAIDPRKVLVETVKKDSG